MTAAERPWLAASAAWTGLIFFSSTSAAARYCESAYRWLSAALFGDGPQSGNSLLHFLAEKTVHLALFFVFGVLLAQVLPGPRRFVKVALAGLIVGAASEYVQSFFPGRDPALRDVLINLTGAALGGAAASLRRT